ncbi:MAG: glycosyltransferase family 4 protein [Vicinamibacterales bacterium]
MPVQTSRLASRLMFDLQKNSAVYGMKVVVPSLLRALFRHSRQTKFALFTRPGREDDLAQLINESPNGAAWADVTVHSHLSLLTESCRSGLDGWFDPASNYPLAAYVRQLCRASYPVTALHHTISYQSYLHNVILPTLLADSRTFDSIVCSSAAARAALLALHEQVAEATESRIGTRLQYRGRLDLIPLGVDTDVFRPRDKKIVRHELGLPSAACIILYFGRVSLRDKGDLRPLISVFDRLRRSAAHYRPYLVIAGGLKGNLANALELQIANTGLADHVRLFPSPHDAQLLYSASDIFVSPAENLQESFGLTIVEALASGVPQVVADWDGYRDTVRDGETGFLVPTRWAACDADLCELAPLLQGDFEYDHGVLAQSVAVDTDALEHFLRVLVENAPLRAAMSERSRARALNVYAWPTIVAEYESLWTELSAAAARSTEGPVKTTAYVKPRYILAFQHYASELVSDEAVIRLTAGGSELCRRGRNAFPHLEDACGLIDTVLLTELLRTLEGAGGQGQSIDGLIIGLSCDVPYKPDVVRRHVMWLLKHALITSTGGSVKELSDRTNTDTFAGGDDYGRTGLNY